MTEKELTKQGFVRKPEWDFTGSKKSGREMFIKNYPSGTVKAYLTNDGVTIGLLTEKDKPLCKKHGFASNIEGMNLIISGWKIC